MATVTLKIGSLLKDTIKDCYKNYEQENNGPYIDFFAVKDHISITIYKNSRNEYKVVFMGDDPLKEAKRFDDNASLNVAKEQIKQEWLNLENQIGSDEVGVGDLFLPIVVVAAFIRKKDIPMLKQFGVTDSKKLSDEKILKIGEQLKDKFFFSKLLLPNEKYNELISKGENLNSIKAKLHNRALLNLYKKIPDTKYIFVDQFCSVKNYYSYLNDKNEIKVTNITFSTKGESYYPSIALASIMARFAFLKEKERLEKEYNVTFPLGGGSIVDDFAKEFIKNHSLEEFTSLVKMNFKNIGRILN